MNKLFNSLYWKISATFVALLFVLGAIYIYVVAFSAEMYFQEANQRLNARVAQRMLNYYKPLVDHRLDSVRLEEIYTIQKIFNPSIEVYVLDTLGNAMMFKKDRCWELRSLLFRWMLLPRCSNRMHCIRCTSFSVRCWSVCYCSISFFESRKDF